MRSIKIPVHGLTVTPVVSLPQETFNSSGASVKASLLFLGKFTEKEQADFDKKQAAARKDVDAKYADLGIGVEGQIDILQDFPVAGISLGQSLHVKDELTGHATLSACSVV